LKAIELKSNSELRQFVTEWTYYGRAMKRKYDAINAAFESLNSSYKKVCKNIDDFKDKRVIYFKILKLKTLYFK